MYLTYLTIRYKSDIYSVLLCSLPFWVISVDERFVVSGQLVNLFLRPDICHFLCAIKISDRCYSGERVPGFQAADDPLLSRLYLSVKKTIFS